MGEEERGEGDPLDETPSTLDPHPLAATTPPPLPPLAVHPSEESGDGCGWAFGTDRSHRDPTPLSPLCRYTERYESQESGEPLRHKLRGVFPTPSATRVHAVQWLRAAKGGSREGGGPGPTSNGRGHSLSHSTSLTCFRISHRTQVAGKSRGNTDGNRYQDLPQ